MADSERLRARRSYAHKNGDHSLCNPARCVVAGPTSTDDEPGPVEEAVRDFAAAVRFSDNDPRAVMTVVAVQLAQALDQTPGSASIAQQLQTTMRWMAENPAEPADRLDERRARVAQMRVEQLLGARG